MASATIRPCRHCSKPVIKTANNWPRDRKGNLCQWFYCGRLCYDQFRSHLVSIETRQCLKCATIFHASPGMKKKYCSEKCWKAKKKATPKNCMQCGVLFTPVKFHHQFGRFISHNGGKTCSDVCLKTFYRENKERKAKISAAFKGDKHPLWKGGRSYFSNASYRGIDWKLISAKVRKRDAHKCVECGMTQEEHTNRGWNSLQVHHVVPFHNFSSSEKANQFSNLLSLCKSCHRKADAKVRQVQFTMLFADNAHAKRNGIKRAL